MIDDVMLYVLLDKTCCVAVVVRLFLRSNIITTTIRRAGCTGMKFCEWVLLGEVKLHLIINRLIQWLKLCTDLMWDVWNT